MKIIFKTFFDYLLFSHLFLALCTVAQAALTYLIICKNPDLILLLVLFLGAIFIYNMRVILDYKKIKATSLNNGNFRVDFVRENVNSIFILASVSAISIIPVSFLLNQKTMVAGFISGIIALAYSFPFISKLNGGLRQIPGMKTFLVAGVWALGTVLLPILQSNIELKKYQVAILLEKRFMFIFVLALLFDLRDIESDRKFGLKTIATILGTFNTKILCLILLACQLFLIIHFDPNLDWKIFIGLLISGLLVSFFVIISSAKQSAYFSLFWIDGLMITHYLFVLLAIHLL